MDDMMCGICGESMKDPVKDEYKHQLKCGHTFHYMCLSHSFKASKGINECPYCRSKGHKLPLVNGLKKPILGVNDFSDFNNYVNTGCKHVLTRGKHKDEKCNCNCKLGYEYCKRHIKNIHKD
tara:strand:+ start:625 stop:990 length:366 start_codon:yes stop_codon:yes gene_type:complete